MIFILCYLRKFIKKEINSLIIVLLTYLLPISLTQSQQLRTLKNRKIFCNFLVNNLFRKEMNPVIADVFRTLPNSYDGVLLRKQVPVLTIFTKCSIIDV